MIVLPAPQVDLLQLLLGMKLRGAVRDDEEPRPRQPTNDFLDLLNTQYAQAAGTLPRPAAKARANIAKPPAKRERPSDDPRKQRERETSQQRRSAWA